MNTVSIDLWKGVFREASARVEAAIDLLQQIIGPEELGWLVEQLAALGMFASLQNTQLVALLAQKRSWQGPRWGMVEEMLSLLDPAGTGEVPARPLARLLSKRAEAFWQNQVADATAHVPFSTGAIKCKRCGWLCRASAFCCKAADFSSPVLDTGW